MSTPPAQLQFKKADFPSAGLGSQEALDKFFLQLNQYLEQARQCLTRGVSIAENTAFELKTLTVKTPATDWTTPGLNSGWSVFGGITVRYRKDSMGVVWVEGLATNSAQGTVFTLPAGYRPGVQKDFASAFSVGGTESFGRLRVKLTGDVDLVGTNPTTYGSLDCSFLCSDLSPAVLPCWPVDFTLERVRSPVGLVLADVEDVTPGKEGGGTPRPLTLGTPDWTLLSASKVRLKNLPGLALGRTYSVTLLALPA